MLGNAQLVVGSTVYCRGFDGSVEAEVLQPFVGVGQLRGTIEGGTVRSLEVDGGGEGTQVHESAVVVAHRYIAEGHVGVAQLEGLATTTEITGCVYHEVAQ